MIEARNGLARLYDRTLAQDVVQRLYRHKGIYEGAVHGQSSLAQRPHRGSTGSFRSLQGWDTRGGNAHARSKLAVAHTEGLPNGSDPASFWGDKHYFSERREAPL